MRTRMVGWLRLILTAASLVFVATRIEHIGVQAVLNSMPASMAFYLILVAAYAIPPYFDWRIYRRAWLLERRDFALMVRKRSLNEALVDYAGEIEFMLRMRHHANAGSFVKDVNILSGLVSNGATILLVLALIAAGDLALLERVHAGLGRSVIAACAITGLVLAVIGIMHRRLLAVNRAERIFILRQHGLKLASVLMLQIAQWSSALPTVEMTRWLLFIALWMIVTRLPFMPSRDIVLAATGVALAGAIDASQPAVAAMFLAGGVMPLMLHAAVLVATSFWPGPGVPRAASGMAKLS